MAKANVIGFPLVRAMLLGTTAIALFGAPFSIPEASARVGVTSATDGDPLGKPPSEAERVLRIGIDVQANEVITTNARDRAHLVFLDGTSLTVGPSAQLTIDKFVYDPATKTGDLAINASKGVFRLVGGKISKTKPITITTPSGTIGIRGGITIFTVQPTSTTSTFVFGNGMTFTAAGQTQTVTRPGSQVTAASGAAPGAPTMVGQGGLAAQLSQLEGTSQSGGQSGGGGGGGTGGNADQKAQSSGFSSGNSGQAPGTVQQGANIGPTPAAQKINNSELMATALSNNNTEQQTAQAAASQKQTAAPAPVTQVIVTRGRFFGDTPYTAFNNQTLGVTPDPQMNVLLSAEGKVTEGKATITLSDGRSVTVPWNPGANPFAVSLNHPTFGVLNGKGYVSSSGDYFAYVFETTNNARIGVIGGTPTTLGQFPSTGFAKHTVIDLGDPARLPFANDTVGNDAALKAAATKSALYSAYSGNFSPTVGGPMPGDTRATALQATVSISGQGASQKSYIGAFIGTYFKDNNNSTIANGGRFNASYRLGDTQQIGRLVSAQSTFDTGAGNSIFGPNGETMVFTPDSLSTTVTPTTSTSGIVSTITTTRTPQASFDQPYNDLSGSDYYSVSQATKTSSSPTTDNARTSQTMNGYVGGIVEQRNNSGTVTTRVLGNTSPTNVILITDPASNRASATFTVPEWDGSTTSATFQLGGTTGSGFSISSFIDDKIYAMADRPADVLDNTTSITVNSVTSAPTDVQSRTFAVSYGTAPIDTFFTDQNVTKCTCDFLTWGWWSGDVKYEASSAYNTGGRDRLNLATYVAGTLSTVADLNTLNQQNATATYTGHMVGNVQNGASAYVAAGSYTNNWSFGTQTGKAFITFDGASYGSNITANTQLTGGIGGGPTFSTPTPLPSTSGPARSLTLNGAFVNAPGVPAKGQIGNFAVNGSGYQAGGTFAAQKP